MRNHDVARLLDDIAAALELKGESEYRSHAYQEAARRIEGWPEDVLAMCRDGRLTEIPGVGASIAEKIAGYLQTGRSPYLEGLITELPPQVFELLKLPGIGPRKANLLYRELHVTSLRELAEAAREHRVRDIPGMGEKTEEHILEAIAEHLSRRPRDRRL